MLQAYIEVFKVAFILCQKILKLLKLNSLLLLMGLQAIKFDRPVTFIQIYIITHSSFRTSHPCVVAVNLVRTWLSSLTNA